MPYTLARLLLKGMILNIGLRMNLGIYKNKLVIKQKLTGLRQNYFPKKK